jgi:hypothetical protein
MSAPLPTLHSPWRRVVALSVALAAVVAIVVIAFAWPSVTSAPKDVPLAVTGPHAAVVAVKDALHRRAGDVFRIHEVADRAAAVRAIERRQDEGGIVLGDRPEILTASAGSPIIAQQLGALAPALQAQLQAAIAARLPAGAPVPTVTVAVSDVVPLADSDARGAGLITAAFPIVLGGMLGGIGITLALVGALRRMAALGVYVVVGGVVLAAVLQSWFGVLQGSFVVNAAVLALALLAIGAPIVGLAALVGRVGLAVGPVLFLLIGNPISSATQPVEFLPTPWGQVGQWFPPGAAATLLRDTSYFVHADAAFPWLVLGGWALAGVVLGLAGHFRQAGGATAEAITEARAEADAGVVARTGERQHLAGI